MERTRRRTRDHRRGSWRRCPRLGWLAHALPVYVDA